MTPRMAEKTRELKQKSRGRDLGFLRLLSQDSVVTVMKGSNFASISSDNGVTAHSARKRSRHDQRTNASLAIEIFERGRLAREFIGSRCGGLFL